MKCNACPRSARFLLKLTVAQHKFPGDLDGKFRFSISVETEGGYCIECKQRIERKVRDGLFEEVFGPYTMQEFATIFHLRGWGEPSWTKGDTVAEFTEIQSTPNENQLALKLEQIPKGR